MNQPNTQLAMKRTPSDISPRLPSGSRKPIASGGRPGAAFGKEHRDQEGIAGIKSGEHQARNERALIHVADRLAELVGHHDQNQRGRNDCASVPEAAMMPVATRRS